MYQSAPRPRPLPRCDDEKPFNHSAIDLKKIKMHLWPISQHKQILYFAPRRHSCCMAQNRCNRMPQPCYRCWSARHRPTVARIIKTTVNSSEDESHKNGCRRRKHAVIEKWKEAFGNSSTRLSQCLACGLKLIHRSLRCDSTLSAQIRQLSPLPAVRIYVCMSVTIGHFAQRSQCFGSSSSYCFLGAFACAL